MGAIRMPNVKRVRGMALALVLGVAAGWTLPASAQTASPAEMEDAQRLFVAGQALLAAVNEAEQRGQRLPLLSEDPDLIRAAFDVDLAQKLAAAPVGLIRPACEPAGDAKMAYLVTGTNEAEATSSDPSVRARAMRAAASNFVQYQDETALAMRFEIRCSALLLPGFEEYVGGLTEAEAQEMRQDAAGIRRGHVNMLDTALIWASSAMTEPANSSLLLEEIQRQGPALARSFTADQRRQLLARLDTVDRSRFPAPDQERYAAIRQALEGVDCGPLCVI